ncbi:MAG: WD40/YVTN/BNR-like repeat-containing protein, partial [Gammaproteobacteria bacterium]
RSADDGRSWTKLRGGDASLFALHVRTDGTGFAVGQSGVVLKTTDDGLSWSALASGTKANLLGVRSTAKGRVVVPGMRHLLISDDDGASWRDENEGELGRAWTVAAGAAAGSESTLVVGEAERIIRVGGVR